jgi:hypothetical protein
VVSEEGRVGADEKQPHGSPNTPTLDDNVTDIASELGTSLGSGYSIGGDQQLNYREVEVSSVPKNCIHDHTIHRMELTYVQKVQYLLRPKSTVSPAVPCYKG